MFANSFGKLRLKIDLRNHRVHKSLTSYRLCSLKSNLEILSIELKHLNANHLQAIACAT